MEKKYSIGIGINLFDTRAILLRDDGKVIMSIEKKRRDTDANQTIEMLLELFEEIVSKAKKYKNEIDSAQKQMEDGLLAMGDFVSNTSKEAISML